MMSRVKRFINEHKLFLCFLAFVIAFAISLMTFARRESDYFWHIKAGEYMVQHGLLRKDVFSWYASGKYWMSHEWLFEIIIYAFRVVFPKTHILVYCFIFTLSLLLILFLPNREGFTKNIPFGMLWTSFSLILLVFMQGRPHLISFNLLALTIWALYDNYKKEDSKLIYMLPLVTILWANVHGGSSNLSYLFCFVFLIFGMFQFKFTKIVANRISKKQMLKYLIVGVFCMVCINFNLHGLKMFTYPYENMMDTLMLNNISEWAPTNLNSISHYPYLLLVVLILFVFLFSKKKIEFMDFVLFGISIFLGFKSVRFWAYTYIIMTFVVFHYLDKRKLDKGTYGILVFVSVVLLGITFGHRGEIWKQLNWETLTQKDIRFVLSENPKKLYNMYNYGGELVYAGVPVFIDGRADLYSKYNYEDCLMISQLQGDYVQLIDKYDFDYFLVDKMYPISTYLKYDSNYELIYKNKDVLFYKKKN